MPVNDDLELMNAVLSEGTQYLDLMYLPSGAVAWLFDQPDPQVHSAMSLAKEAHLSDNPVVHATLLKDDQLIIICQLQSGRKIRIYPDGGFSSDGKPYDLGSLVSLIVDDIPQVEQGARPGEEVAEPPIGPGGPGGLPGVAPVGSPDRGAPAPTGMDHMVEPMGASEPPIEPLPDESTDLEDELLDGMGVKPLSDLM